MHGTIKVLVLGKNGMVEVEKVFCNTSKSFLYFGTPFLSIPVIKVVKKLIEQKTCENIKISRIRWKRAKKFQRKLK